MDALIKKSAESCLNLAIPVEIITHFLKNTQNAIARGETRFFCFFYLTFLSVSDIIIDIGYILVFSKKEGGLGGGTEKEDVCPALQFR